MNSDLRFIDLFCGIGGFHQAMNRLGGTCVFASDIDEQCRQTYEANYGLKPAGDITKVDIATIPDFDVLCGGFPCQSFSNSGKKKGFEDKRGNLFKNILAIAVAKQPKYMFLENVKHIKKIDDGNVFAHILGRIEESGYTVSHVELSPHQLGIPQQRERVIFICIRNDIYTGPVEIPIPSVPIDLSRILETDASDKYRITKDVEQVLDAWDEMIAVFDTGESLSPTILASEFYTTYTAEEFDELPQWKQDYIVKNRPIYTKYRALWDAWYEKHREILGKREIYSRLEWQTGKKKANDSIYHHFIQLRQSGIRVKKGVYFPTLVAIVQTPIYAKEKRYITPRECARLQSFPDSFKLHENDRIAYKQFGNAVNVDVVHYVISHVLQENQHQF